MIRYAVLAGLKYGTSSAARTHCRQYWITGPCGVRAFAPETAEAASSIFHRGGGVDDALEHGSTMTSAASW